MKLAIEDSKLELSGPIRVMETLGLNRKFRSHRQDFHLHPRLKCRCLFVLAYGGVKWSRRWVLPPHEPVYKTGALLVEPLRHKLLFFVKLDDGGNTTGLFSSKLNDLILSLFIDKRKIRLAWFIVNLEIIQVQFRVFSNKF